MRSSSHAPTMRSSYIPTSYTSTPVQPAPLSHTRTNQSLMPRDDRAPGAGNSSLRRVDHSGSSYYGATSSYASSGSTTRVRGQSPAVGRTSYATTGSTTSLSRGGSDSYDHRSLGGGLPRSTTDYGTYSHDPTLQRRPSLTSTGSGSGLYQPSTTTPSTSERRGRDTDPSTGDHRYGASSSSASTSSSAAAHNAAASMMPPARAGSSSSLRSTGSSSSSRVAPVGFRNIGNTCYMNSALQCVLHGSAGFVQDLAREPIRHKSEARSRTSRLTTTDPEPTATALVQLIRSDGATSSLLAVKTGVSRINAEFVGARQNDGHEFVRELLHSIHKEINRIQSKPKYVEMKDIPGEADHEAARRWIAYSKTHDDSLVYDYFGGFLRSVTKCGACGHRSLVFDPFLDLSINLHSSVYSGLAKMNEFESVQVFKCEECKKKGVQSNRQTVVVEWPRVLVIHLKRFSQSGRKDAAAVSYPLRITKDDAAAKEVVFPRSAQFPAQGYTLSGVVLHHGSSGFGHYTAYVRHGTTWYECDDSSITRTSESTVLSAKTGAYVLFYSSED